MRWITVFPHEGQYVLSASWNGMLPRYTYRSPASIEILRARSSVSIGVGGRFFIR
jgi:hypothetical protein